MDEGLCAGPVEEPDRYTLWAVVGGGAEGKVYRATRTLRDGHLDVAVKIMLPERFGTRGEPAPLVAERWMAQAARLRNLRHPGLVGVQESFLGPAPHTRGEQAGGEYAYFVMAWVEGPDFASWIAEHPEAGSRLGVLENVADALDELHGAGLVHADVKPGNVLVRRSELPSGAAVEAGVLVDFGVMRQITGARPTQMVFTAGYAAPELWDDDPYSAASDLYAFAGLALFALTGEHPPLRDSAGQARQRLEVLGVPEVTVDAISMALDPDPAQRGATGVRSWLASARGGLTSSTRAAATAMRASVGAAPPLASAPVLGPKPARPPTGRGRLVVVAAVLVAIGLVGALLAFTAGGGGDDDDTALAAGADPAAAGEDEATSTSSPRSTSTSAVRTTTTVERPTTTGGPTTTEHATTTTAKSTPSTAPPTTVPAPRGETPVVNALFLDELEPVEDTVYYYETGVARANGVEYVHAAQIAPDGCTDPSYVDFDLGRSWSRLTGEMALRDDTESTNMTRWAIYLDNVENASGDLRLGQTVPLDIDVTNVLRVRFEFLDTGCSYPRVVVVGDARLTR